MPCGGGSVPSTLGAVDEETGEERWRTKVVADGAFDLQLIGPDAWTGRVRWTRDTFPPWTYSHAIGRRVVALGGTCNDN